MSTVSVQKMIKASPEAVWDLVSDVTRMGEWSPETYSAQWIKGATGPVPGARFRGKNRLNGRAWAISSRVVEAERGRVFSFEPLAGPVAYALWSYRLEPHDEGCIVTQSAQDRRNWLFRMVGRLLTGVRDRTERNRVNIAETLENLAVVAEGESVDRGT